MLRFNISDAQLLHFQLEAFHIKLEGDWQSLIFQWDKLKECWNDTQYNEFEQLFETLSIRYFQLIERRHEYNLFLQHLINKLENIPEQNYSEINTRKRNRCGSGKLIRSEISQLPNDLKGIYYIYACDIANLENLETIYYIGKAEDSIKNKLLFHLDKSSNQKLRKVIASDQSLVFYWYESSTPGYEEVLEIRRLRNKSMFIGEFCNQKVVIEKLDVDFSN